MFLSQKRMSPRAQRLLFLVDKNSSIRNVIKIDLIRHGTDQSYNVSMNCAQEIKRTKLSMQIFQSPIIPPKIIHIYKDVGTAYWLGWESWAGCDTPCDNGHRKRYRICSIPQRCLTGTGQEAEECMTGPECDTTRTGRA